MTEATEVLLHPLPIQQRRYQYQGIRDGSFMRIFLLEPGTIDDPIGGRLELADIRTLEPYEALSYVWGEPKPLGINNYTVSLGDKHDSSSLELTRSLYEALKRLRLKDRSRRIWADQICINQQDDEDRGMQVGLMGLIFKKASHVLVWLGLDEMKIAEGVFDFIRKLDERFQNSERQKKLHAAYTEDYEEQYENEWDILRHFTALPWFKRAWVVQEIGTKAPATMIWGQSEMEWRALHRVCEKMADYHHFRKRFNIRTGDVKYAFERFIEPDPESYHANRFNFIYELHRARHLQITDQRDRIFAWLGHYSILTPNKELAGLAADYRKSVAELYIDVARRALTGANDERTGSALIALAAVQHMTLPSRSEAAVAENGTETETADGGTLPTWVPDWRTSQSFILSEPVNAHRAHGTSSPRLEVLGGDHPILRIDGVEIDTVGRCSRPLANNEFHAKPPGERAEPAIQYLWRDICRQGQLNLREAYPGGQEALFALMQTVSNGCVQIASREGAAYHEIPRGRWLAQHIAYLTRTVAASAVCPELRQRAEGLGAERGSGEWSRAANGASKNRKFATTERGYYVLGPKVMQGGDVVCVLLGGKMPFCLRPWHGGRYLLVGECYVHGFMDGEAMDMLERAEVTQKTFEIV